MMSNSLSDLAYCAGLFDGEGCISLCKDNNSVYRLYIKISSTDYSLLEWVQEHFGGSIYRERKGTEKRKESWGWNCKINDHIIFLFSILPFTKIKRLQIIEALNYYYVKQNGGRLTNEEIILREGYCKRLKAMK